MNKRFVALNCLTLATLVAQPMVAMGRDTINIVGSSTVYPFATAAAETFGKRTDFKTPKVEATGSGGGMKLFCNGIGVQYPDVTNSSRRIKKSEFDNCIENGVTDIIELKIGYDGIVLANSRSSEQYNLSTKDIFLALGKDVPNPDGSESLVENPYTTWNQVNSELPEVDIEVLGPPPTSGTRDAFAELALEGGCNSFEWIKAMKTSDKDTYKSVCHSIREDGAYIETGENDNLIVQKLDSNPKAIGVFGFSFLDQNEDKIHGALVNGVEPTFEAIAEADYPVSRPLFVYLKKAHIGVIPGIEEFMQEITSDAAWGEDGYLADKGMIPMPDEERESYSAAASDRTNLNLE